MTNTQTLNTVTFQVTDDQLANLRELIEADLDATDPATAEAVGYLALARGLGITAPPEDDEWANEDEVLFLEGES